MPLDANRCDKLLLLNSVEATGVQRDIMQYISLTVQYISKL
jgi:hypothetical protein